MCVNGFYHTARFGSNTDYHRIPVGILLWNRDLDMPGIENPIVILRRFIGAGKNNRVLIVGTLFLDKPVIQMIYFRANGRSVLPDLYAG